MNPRLISGALLTAAVALFAPSSARAQVGPIPLPYPGWIPADRVDETIVVAPAYDPVQQAWRYEYVLTNGILAEQDIWDFMIRQDAWTTSASAPAGWDVNRPSQSTFDPAGPGMEATEYRATLPSDFTGRFWPPSAYQLPPGETLSGFAQESPYPPGYARTYTQGYSGSPWEPDPLEDPEAYEAMNPTPHDTTNSQRAWTLGPAIYREVVTGGNRRPATDGFLGFMNLSEKSSILTDPAPIALKFSLNGETVMRETLQVTLNGVDVTADFHPGPADGADLVGVFRLGSSPLQEGKNVLLTSVEGIIPSNGHVGTDSDRIVFLVDPSLATSGFGSTNALLNLPLPEPGLILN